VDRFAAGAEGFGGGLRDFHLAAYPDDIGEGMPEVSHGIAAEAVFRVKLAGSLLESEELSFFDGKEFHVSSLSRRFMQILNQYHAALSCSFVRCDRAVPW